MTITAPRLRALARLIAAFTRLASLIVVVGVLAGLSGGCDSNPTPHPGRDDATRGNGAEPGLADPPGDGLVDEEGDNLDNDPSAADATGGFSGESDGCDKVEPDVAPADCDAAADTGPEDVGPDAGPEPGGDDDNGACEAASPSDPSYDGQVEP